MSALKPSMSLLCGYAVLATVGAVTLTVSTPASATKGREAVGMCIDSTANGSRCAWSVNDKGEIDICNKNGCVYCPSATSDCTVVSRARPRPSLTLPPGTKVQTTLGAHTVSRRAINDRALLREMVSTKRRR